MTRTMTGQLSMAEMCARMNGSQTTRGFLEKPQSQKTCLVQEATRGIPGLHLVLHLSIVLVVPMEGILLAANLTGRRSTETAVQVSFHRKETGAKI